MHPCVCRLHNPTRTFALALGHMLCNACTHTYVRSALGNVAEEVI